MEDAYFSQLKIGEKQFDNVFGVLDGHNGKEIANFVKEHFVEHLTTNENFKNYKYEIGLREAFLSLDKSLSDENNRKIILEQSQKESEKEEEDFLQPSAEFSEEDKEQVKLFQKIFDPRNLEDCNVAMFTGSCGCVCLFGANDIYLAHLGNTQAIMFNENKKVFLKTQNHTTSSDEDKKRIELAEGFIEDKKVNGVIEYCRSFGDLEYKQNDWLKQEDQMVTANPTIIKTPVEKQSFIFIASNGVWECTNENDIMDFVIGIKDNTNPEKEFTDFLTQKIAQSPPEKGKINESKGYDNMTCMLIKVGEKYDKREIPKKDKKTMNKGNLAKKKEEEKKEEKKEEIKPVEEEIKKEVVKVEEEKKEEAKIEEPKPEEVKKEEEKKEEEIKKEEEKKEEPKPEENKTEEVKAEEEKKEENKTEEEKKEENKTEEE
ncbi:MAG: protein phosphatase 2C family protein, partial [archaeon]|nr:protein phosphatase 2C family protein [archaeon]